MWFPSAAPALTGRDACFDSRGGWEFQNPPARLIFRNRPGKGTGLAEALCCAAGQIVKQSCQQGKEFTGRQRGCSVVADWLRSELEAGVIVSHRQLYKAYIVASTVERRDFQKIISATQKALFLGLPRSSRD